MKCCKRGKAPLEKWLRKQMNEYNSTSVQQKKTQNFQAHTKYTTMRWELSIQERVDSIS